MGKFCLFENIKADATSYNVRTVSIVITGADVDSKAGFCELYLFSSLCLSLNLKAFKTEALMALPLLEYHSLHGSGQVTPD